MASVFVVQGTDRNGAFATVVVNVPGFSSEAARERSGLRGAVVIEVPEGTTKTTRFEEWEESRR